MAVLFCLFRFAFVVFRLYMKFSSLFSSRDKLLSDSTNTFLNQYWAEILKELQPALNKAIGNVVKDIVSPFFANFPYHDLFL